VVGSVDVACAHVWGQGRGERVLGHSIVVSECWVQGAGRTCAESRWRHNLPSAVLKGCLLQKHILSTRCLAGCGCFWEAQCDSGLTRQGLAVRQAVMYSH
jgi:hypothetical protein